MPFLLHKAILFLFLLWLSISTEKVLLIWQPLFPKTSRDQLQWKRKCRLGLQFFDYGRKPEHLDEISANAVGTYTIHADSGLRTPYYYWVRELPMKLPHCSSYSIILFLTLEQVQNFMVTTYSGIYWSLSIRLRIKTVSKVKSFYFFICFLFKRFYCCLFPLHLS